MSKMKLFDEDNYLKPQYAYRFKHLPLAHMGMSYSIVRLATPSSIPEVSEIYAFCMDLFVQAQLSAECSIGTPAFLSFSNDNCSYLLSLFFYSLFDICGKIDATCSCTSGRENLATLFIMWLTACFKSMARFKVNYSLLFTHSFFHILILSHCFP